MTICDICEDRFKKTQRVAIKVDMPIIKDNFEFTFDLCSDCIRYVSANSFLFCFKHQNHQNVDQMKEIERLTYTNQGNINDNMDNRGQ